MTRRSAAVAAALRQLADAVELEDEVDRTSGPADHVVRSDGPIVVTARDIGVSPRTLRRAGERGELEVFRVGRSLMTRRADVEAWLAGRSVSRVSAENMPDRERPDQDRLTVPLSDDELDRLLLGDDLRRIG